MLPTRRSFTSAADCTLCCGRCRQTGRSQNSLWPKLKLYIRRYQAGHEKRGYNAISLQELSTNAATHCDNAFSRPGGRQTSSSMVLSFSSCSDFISGTHEISLFKPGQRGLLTRTGSTVNHSACRGNAATPHLVQNVSCGMPLATGL